MKRIDILLPATADDAVFQAGLAAFYQELALLGWSIGRNVRIDTRWATANAAEIRRLVGVGVLCIGREKCALRLVSGNGLLAATSGKKTDLGRNRFPERFFWLSETPRPALAA